MGGYRSSCMSSRLLATNAFWSLVSHVLHRGSLMLAAIFLARSLDPQGFAAYSYFQMTVAMLATYAAMGLGVTASRYFAEFGHAHATDSAPIGTLLALSLLVAIIAFLMVLVLPQEWLQAGLPIPKWLVALGVAVTVAGVVPGGGILGLEKYREATVVSFLSGSVMLGIAWAAATQQSPRFGMWGIVAGMGIQAIGQVVVIARATGWQIIVGSCRWAASDLRKLAGFAGPMFLVSILAGSGTWIVGRMILADGGEQEFAAYSIGLQWLALGVLLPGMVSRVVLPRIVRTDAANAKRLVRAGAIMALAPALLMAAAGLLLAPWLIRLYGGDYASFTFVIPAFLGVAVLSSPINTLGNAILARNGQVTWLRFTALSFGALLLPLMVSPYSNVAWACFSHLMAAAFLLALATAHGKRKELI